MSYQPVMMEQEDEVVTWLKTQKKVKRKRVRRSRQPVEIYDDDIFNNPEDEELWASTTFGFYGH